MSQKQMLQALLDQAGTGVVIDGPSPWDPQVKNPGFYSRLLSEGPLGFAEMYGDGWWECNDRLAMPELFARVIEGNLGDLLKGSPMVAMRLAAYHLGARLTNPQTIEKSREVGKIHYDEDAFTFAVYDKRVTGSCAIWHRGAKSLDEAQEEKLEDTCRQLKLEPGMRVLDIGCGWGSFMGYAHEKYGAISTGITISEGQARYARERYEGTPLEFRVEDYRQFRTVDKFDRVNSIGMFEHVGEDNYDAFFGFVRSVLKDDGLFFLHTITGKKRSRKIDPAINKYIFPGGQLPTEAQIYAAIQGTFVVERMENIGADYDPTLCAWRDNLLRNWDTVVAAEGLFKARIYEYYLTSCAGGFRSRGISVQRFLMSPNGVRGGYQRMT